jgi:hypothetical protein
MGKSEAYDLPDSAKTALYNSWISQGSGIQLLTVERVNI